jgi:hypothetical protein
MIVVTVLYDDYSRCPLRSRAAVDRLARRAGPAGQSDEGVPLNSPVSMAYEYGSWKELEPSEGRFEFEAWEAKSWNRAPAAGKQVVLRVVLDYPNEPVDVPQWLIDKGVKMTHYDEFGGGYSPDYDDPRLLGPLLTFVRAFGKRYDHNDRVAYVQLGLLGHWGEWHTYPRDELFASEKVQAEVIQAMHEAFPDKPLLARNASYRSCQLPWLGFHDDMIPSDTFGTEDWEFLPAIQKGGVGTNWKVAPLGGEMVPGAAAQYLGKDWPLLQRAVKEAHFTWIGPYCPAMKPNPTKQELARIEDLIRSLGYQFRLITATIPEATRSKSSLAFTVTGLNEGVAPLYASWKPTFALIDETGRVIQRIESKANPRSWLPGQFSLEANGMAPASPGKYRIGFGIVDPASGKARVRFANALDSIDGFTVIGKITVTASADRS